MASSIGPAGNSPHTSNEILDVSNVDHRLAAVSVWEQVQTYFSPEHQLEAENCIHAICSLPENAILQDIETPFFRLRTLAYPGYENNFQHYSEEENRFSILDRNAHDILSADIDEEGCTVSFHNNNDYSITNRSIPRNDLINEYYNEPSQQVGMMTQYIAPRLRPALRNLFESTSDEPINSELQGYSEWSRTVESFSSAFPHLYQGPQGSFVNPLTSSSDNSSFRMTHPLHRVVTHWLEPAEAERWEEYNNEMNADAFSKFLIRLHESQHNDPNITGWLKQLTDDAQLREKTFLAAMEAAESCEDRITLAYHKMQAVSLSHKIENAEFDQNLPALIDSARELYRLEQIEKISRKQVDRQRAAHVYGWEYEIDEIEVYLAYQHHLREPLMLTSVTEHSKFIDLSGLNIEEIEAAEKQIKEDENLYFATWFEQWSPWHNTLERIAPEAYKHAMDERYRIFDNDYEHNVNTKLRELDLSGNADLNILLDTESAIGLNIKNEINKDIFHKLTSQILIKEGIVNILSSRWN